MSTPDLAEIGRRLEQVENALADAQARVPGLRREVGSIRVALTEAGRQAVVLERHASASHGEPSTL